MAFPIKFILPWSSSRCNLGVLLAAALFCLPAEAQEREGVEFFENRVRPLLAEHCYSCHGEKRQRSGLRLDRPADIQAGGERGPLFLAGDPDRSLLIQAVRYDDEDLQMPLKDKLPEAAIADLVRWVEIGAPLPKIEGERGVVPETFDMESRKRHWAFQPIQSVETPQVVGQQPEYAIDAFVLARMQQAGLEPVGLADRRALIRRLSFDLTGLPPTPAEVESFVEDRSKRAYERLVERLLDSPHFGEHWARHWLDLMRYGETRGHEFDFEIPNPHEYRDYVIRAFQADVPYDQFVTEHLAGDLLTEPRLHPDHGWNESVLGTGFWFLGEEMHSPVDIRADETDRTTNKIDVVSRAFLGLTVACARCHDHKFDAISTKDFYALAGYALSGSYRQVRFETMAHNAAVARELEQLRARARPRLAQAVGRSLEHELAQLADYLVAADEVWHTADIESKRKLTIPKNIDLLFEDFEGEDYGEWSVEGTAFGTVPRRVGDIAKHQGKLGARGQGLVNTHQTRDGEDARGADRHIGTLTSPRFEIERDYIHCLISGGSHEGATELQLLVGGKVVQAVRGKNSNNMKPAVIDARGWRGKRARLRIFDSHTEGWGHVGVDHIVFSDKPGPEALVVDEAPRVLARRQLAIREQARAHGLERSRLQAWVDAARAASSEGGAGLARIERVWSSELPVAPLADHPDFRVHADFRQPIANEFFLPDGFQFGSETVARGHVRLGHQTEDPVEGLIAVGGIWKDSTWDGLKAGQGVQGEPGSVSWNQPGHTFRTPTFTLEQGKLHYLVYGSGRVYAAVDGHRLISGPLHGRLVREWKGGESFQWVQHDLSPYVGHRVHLEFSSHEPAGLGAGHSDDFGLIVVGEGPQRPDLFRAPWSDASSDAASERARVWQARFQRALQAWRHGLDEGFTAADARLLDWWLRHPQLWLDDDHERELDKTVGDFFSRQSELEGSIRLESRLAPAILEGSGVNEFVLIRGSPRSPGDVVPRRFLEALAGTEAEPDDGGSGRLALARKMTDPDNPLLTRVLVNRVWHHMFGRGIVASVDDFGVNGDRPTHPELLDYLARRFVRGGWSLKALLREIALSEAYRRSSRRHPRAEEVDPTNQWLARARVRRLTGESIRDSILAVSGELKPELYGPSVDIHLTPFLEGRGRPKRSGPLDGAGRRSLYLSVRRNFLHPFLSVFDFPAPATTRGRRSVSNVPAQALALMNDPFVAEQARKWAQRVLSDESWKRDRERVDALFEQALGRPPKAEERRAALSFVEGSGAEEDEVRLEAWADLCHVLYNTKEFVYLR